MNDKDMHTMGQMSDSTAALPYNTVAAMAYVPFQMDASTYDDRKALEAGTLFPALNKPFLASHGRCC